MSLGPSQVETIEAQPVALLSEDERPIIRALSQFASDDAAGVRRGIARAKALGHPAFEEPLHAVMTSDVPPIVRGEAAEALGHLEWPRGTAPLKRRVARLGQAASSGHPVARAGAIRALGRYPTPQASEWLQRLEAQGGASLQPTLQRAAETQRSAKILAAYADWLRRRGAAEEDSPRFEIAEAAAALITEPRSYDAHRHLLTLIGAGDASAVRPLVRYVARHGEPRDRYTATDAIGLDPTPSDLPLLLRLTQDPSPRVRRSTARALGGYTSTMVAARLMTWLQREDDREVLRAVAISLRKQRTRDLVRVAEPVLQAGPGYPREVAAFLIRERDGDETLWPKVLAYVADEKREGLDVLRAVPRADRKRVLLPRLANGLTHPQRLAVLSALEGEPDREIATAVLASLKPQSDREIIRASAGHLAVLDDGTVGQALAKVLVKAEPSRREAYYELLLARESLQARVIEQGLRRDPSATLRAWLIRQATGRTEPELISAVAARLDPSESSAVLTAALGALEHVQDPTLARPYTEVVTRAENEAVLTDLAYRRLIALPDPAGYVALQEIALRTELDAELRARAIGDLGVRSNATNLSFFAALTDDEEGAVRQAARNAMHVIDPEQFALHDRYGRIPLIAVSAGFGAALLGITSEIADANDEREAILGVGGGILGASTAFLLTLDSDISLGEAGFFTTAGVWGTLGGYSLARATNLTEKHDKAALWAALAGEVVGVTAGALALRSSRFDLTDVAFTNLMAASMGMAALGVGYQLRLEDSPNAGPGDLFVLGSLVGAAPMLALSPYITLDNRTMAIVGTSIFMASWVGAWLPMTLHPLENITGLDPVAGVAIGQAAGWTVGLTVAQLTRGSDAPSFGWSNVGWGSLGMVTGAAAGAGFGMMIPELRGQGAFALLEVGTVAGAAVLGTVGPTLELSGTDQGLITMLALSGGVVGGRLVGHLVDAGDLTGLNESQSLVAGVGGAMLGASLGMYAGLTTSQFIELSGGELAMSGIGGGLIGLSAGGLALMAPAIDDGLFSPLFAGGVGVGMLGLSFLTPHVRYTPADVAMGISGGALGGVLGGYTPAYWHDEGESISSGETLGGVMTGAGVGMLATGVVSQFTELDASRVLKIDLGALGGGSVGGGLGLLVPAIDRKGTVALLQAGTVAGFAISTLSERRSNYSGADKARVATGAALGAWHGALIPGLWRRGDLPAHEIAGGALVGLGMGAGVSRLLKRVNPLDPDDTLELGLFQSLGVASGAGLYTLVQGDRRLRFGLMQGAGLLAWTLGEAFVPMTTYEEDDRVWVAGLAGAGALGGAGLPFLLHSRSSTRAEITGAEIAGGIALGTGLLGFGGIALTHLRDTEAGDYGESMLAASFGGIGGLGLAANLAGARGFDLGRAAEIGYLGGLALGVAVSPYTSYDDHDRWWVAGLTSAGAMGGAGLPFLLHGRPARGSEIAGGAALGAGVLGLTAMGLRQFRDDDLRDYGEVMLTATLGGLTGLGSTASVRGARGFEMGRGAEIGYLGGLAASLTLAPYTRFSRDDMLWVTGLVGAGTLGGLGLPFILHDGPARGAEVAGGAAVGAGALGLMAMGLSQVRDVDPEEYGEVVLTSTYGALSGMGLAASMVGTRGFEWARGAEIGYLGGLALSMTLAPYTRYDRTDREWVAGLTGIGALAGAGLPYLLRSRAAPGAQVAGGAALGAGAVGLASMGLMQLWDPAAHDLGEVVVTTTLASLLGLGIPTTDPNTEHYHWLRGAEIGLLSGLALSMPLANLTDYDTDDRAMLVGLTGAGAIGGAGLPFLLHGRDAAAHEVVGGAALGAGAMGLLAMGMTQVRDSDPMDLAEVWLTASLGGVAGLGVAGAVGGAGGAQWARGADIGFLSGLVLSTTLSPYTQYTAADAYWGTAVAGMGTWLGALAPRAVDGRRAGARQMAMGGAGGAAVGSLTVMGLSQLRHFPERSPLEALTLSFGGGLLASGAALAGLPHRQKDQAMLQQGLALAGFVGGAFASEVTEFSGRDAGLIATTTALGTWHGVFAPAAFGDTSAEATIGGAMMGAGGGLLLSYGMSQFTELEAGDNVELVFATAAGSLAGGGLALMLDWGRVDSARSLEIGSLIGLGLGASLAGVTEYDGDDFGELTFGTAWGAWQGLWASQIFASFDDEQQMGGGAMLGAGAGMFLGVTASQLLDLDGGDLMEASVWTGAGNLIGYGIGGVAGLDRSLRFGLLQAGGVAGLGTALALSKRSEYSGLDTLLIGTTTAMGAWHGTLLRGLTVDAEHTLTGDDVARGVMLGSGVGLATGMLVAPHVEMEPADLGEMMLTMLASDAVGWGLAEWTGAEGRAYFALIEGVGLAGSALGLTTAALTDFDGADRLQLLHGAVVGGMVGGMAPGMWHGTFASDEARTDAGAGLVLGVGLGALSGGLISQFYDLEEADIGEAMLGSAMSAVAGAGLGLMLDEDMQGPIASMGAFALAGTIGTSLAAPHNDYTGGDAALGLVAGLYGVYQGAGIAGLLESSNREVAGSMMLGGGLGVLAGMYLGRHLNLDFTQYLTLLAGSAWGAWIGAWTAAVIEQRVDPDKGIFELGLGATAVATDVALVLTSFAVSELVDLHPLQFAWISVGGGAGMVVGLVASAFAKDGFLPQEGVLYGTIGGLAISTVVTSFFDFDTAPQSGPEHVATAATGGPGALIPVVEEWFPSMQVQPADQGPGGGPPGEMRYLMTVTGTFR